jgi:hypothetical protein
MSQRLDWWEDDSLGGPGLEGCGSGRTPVSVIIEQPPGLEINKWAVWLGVGALFLIALKRR